MGFGLGAKRETFDPQRLAAIAVYMPAPPAERAVWVSRWRMSVEVPPMMRRVMRSLNEKCRMGNWVGILTLLSGPKLNKTKDQQIDNKYVNNKTAIGKRPLF